jgi:hypothetical protein
VQYIVTSFNACSHKCCFQVYSSQNFGKMIQLCDARVSLDLFFNSKLYIMNLHLMKGVSIFE